MVWGVVSIIRRAGVVLQGVFDGFEFGSFTYKERCLSPHITSRTNARRLLPAVILVSGVSGVRTSLSKKCERIARQCERIRLAITTASFTEALRQSQITVIVSCIKH